MALWRDPKAWWHIEADAYREQRSHEHKPLKRWQVSWPRVAVAIDLAAFVIGRIVHKYWHHH